MLNLPLRVVTKSKLSVAASSFSFTDFSGIPAGTRHLALIVNARNDTGQASVLLRFNNDSGTNYNFQTLKGAGGTPSAASTNSATSITCFDHPNTASTFGGGMILIPHYANTANHKVVLTVGGDNEQSVMAHVGRWTNSGAITRIDVLASANNFVANSIALLCAVDERYLVEESNLSADGTVTFSSIPQTPGDLIAIGYCRTDRAAASDAVAMTVNADVTNANYGRQRLTGNLTTYAAQFDNDRLAVPLINGDSVSANGFGAFVVSISQHANGVKQPHILVLSGFYEGENPSSQISLVSMRRANIAAYTTLAFNPNSGTNFKSGSLFSLYHVPKRLVAYKKLTADAATITHTVPAGHEALVETVFARSDAALAADPLYVSFNNDVTNANYDVESLSGDGTTVIASQNLTTRSLTTDAYPVPAASAAANIFAGGLLMIPAYTETDRHKHRLFFGGAADDNVVLSSGRWENTAILSEIDFTLETGPNFKGN